MTILLKSATIVNPKQPDLHLKKKDILIENGQITSIANRISEDGAVKTIRLDKLHVSPGWFDSSVSYGEPGFEERETIKNGLKVAGKSGFTGIVLNTNTQPIPDSSGDISYLRETARGSLTELFPLGALSRMSEGKDLAELYDMHLTGSVGFSDYKNPTENPNLLKMALLYSQSFDGLVFSFPMDGQLAGMGQMHEGEVSVRLGLKGMPALAEQLRVERDLAILEYTGGKLHIPTISTEAAVTLIAGAKKKGLNVSCSVSIHNLAKTDKALENFDSVYKVLPPLRGSADQKALLKALKSGVIDFVCSDHCPIDIEGKKQEFDRSEFGSLGLESSFGILSQLFDLSDCIELLTRGRARFGLPEPGIAVGEKANLTLFDPEFSYTQEVDKLASTSKNSMYLGTELQGRVYGIIVGNRTNL